MLPNLCRGLPGEKKAALQSLSPRSCLSKSLILHAKYPNQIKMGLLGFLHCSFSFGRMLCQTLPCPSPTVKLQLGNGVFSSLLCSCSCFTHTVCFALQFIMSKTEKGTAAVSKSSHGVMNIFRSPADSN